MFNPERYRSRIEESMRLIEITSRFEEPERVPVQISTAGSYYAWLQDVNINDFYQDRDLMVDVQLKGLEWAYEELQDDRTTYSVNVELGPIGEALLFDCPIEYHDGTSPRIQPILETREDVEKLEVPDPAKSKGIQWALGEFEKVKQKLEKMGLDLPVGGGFGIHPPLSCACSLMESELVYVGMYEDPEMIKMLFDKCLEAYFRLAEFMIELNGGVRGGFCGMADDNSAFVSDDMYREMVMPYNMAIYERYGQKGRWLHADGPNDHHFETYADIMKLTSMDIGGFSDVEKAKKAMHGKVVMSGGLNCKDFYGTLDDAKPAINRSIRIGAPGGGFILAVGGETYPGCRPETLIQGVQYAKEVGRYPLDPEKLAD